MWPIPMNKGFDEAWAESIGATAGRMGRLYRRLPALVAQRIAALIVLRPDQTEATIRAQCSRLASEWKNRTFGDVPRYRTAARRHYWRAAGAISEHVAERAIFFPFEARREHWARMVTSVWSGAGRSARRCAGRPGRGGAHIKPSHPSGGGSIDSAHALVEAFIHRDWPHVRGSPLIVCQP